MWGPRLRILHQTCWVPMASATEQQTGSVGPSSGTGECSVTVECCAPEGLPCALPVVTVPPTHPRRLYMLPSIWPHLLNLHYPVQAPTASQSPGLFQQPPPGSACPHYHCQPPSHPPPSLCSLVRPCPFSVVHSPMAPTYLANQVLSTCPILFCLPG